MAEVSYMIELLPAFCSLRLQVVDCDTGESWFIKVEGNSSS